VGSACAASMRPTPAHALPDVVEARRGAMKFPLGPRLPAGGGPDAGGGSDGDRGRQLLSQTLGRALGALMGLLSALGTALSTQSMVSRTRWVPESALIAAAAAEAAAAAAEGEGNGALGVGGGRRGDRRCAGGIGRSVQRACLPDAALARGAECRRCDSRGAQWGLSVMRQATGPPQPVESGKAAEGNPGRGLAVGRSNWRLELG